MTALPDPPVPRDDPAAAAQPPSPTPPPPSPAAADSADPPEDLTNLLGRIAIDAAARDLAFRAVYRDLHRIASAHLHRSGESSVQPTDLLHAAYLRLVRSSRDYRGRQHFFAVAALAMKHALVDHVRQRRLRPVTVEGPYAPGSEPTGSYLDRVAASFEERGIALLDLDDALKALEAVDAQAAELAVLVLFGGFSRSEAAELLGLSQRTGDRVWAFARARLERSLAAYRPTEPSPGRDGAAPGARDGG